MSVVRGQLDRHRRSLGIELRRRDSHSNSCAQLAGAAYQSRSRPPKPFSRVGVTCAAPRRAAPRPAAAANSNTERQTRENNCCAVAASVSAPSSDLVPSAARRRSVSIRAAHLSFWIFAADPAPKQSARRRIRSPRASRAASVWRARDKLLGPVPSRLVRRRRRRSPVLRDMRPPHRCARTADGGGR